MEAPRPDDDIAADVKLLEKALGKTPKSGGARNTAERASSIMQTNHATVIIVLMASVLLVTLVVLVGVMLGRRDASVSNAVDHLLGRADQHDPALPDGYPNTRHNVRTIDTLIVLGDQWAAGVGTPDRSTMSWAVRLRDRHCPHATVVRIAQDQGVTTQTIGEQLAVLEPMAAGVRLQLKHVALLVQAGWNDIVAAQGDDDALDVDATADRLARFARDVAANYTARAASTAVYIIDYPDASAGTGYTPIQCEPELARIYNRPRAAAWHITALNMWTEALRAACQRYELAFVPLRDTLRNIGSVPVDDTYLHTMTDVQGHALHNIDNPLPFDSRCGSLNAVGQVYQADVIGAFINNVPYHHVG